MLIVGNYKVLAITGKSPAVVHAADAPQKIKIKEKKIKLVLPGLTRQKRTQKTRFLHVGYTRKLQIAIIIQASWHINNISTFKSSIL